LGFAAELLRDRNLVIFAKVADALKPVPLTSDGGAKIWIHGIPYVEPMEIGAYLGEESLRTHDEALKALTRRMLENQVSREPHVLLCHAFALGGEISESEKEISIGGSSQVDVRAFDGFAYTALGHLHKPQNVGSERVRYSGSLLAYSKSETIAAAPETLSASGARATGKSVTEIRLDTDGGLELETFELPVLRRLRTIEGPLAELLERGREDQFRDDYIIAGFTDLGAQIDTFAKLRAVYPNLLHVSRVGGFLPSELPAARARAEERSERNDLDLFAEFFRDATGTELSDEERAALIETLAESAKGLAREEAG
jgi:exonuclease SbcD